MKNEDVQKQYYHRARIAGYLLQLAPFIRMIGLNGSLARAQAKIYSDIDFIIIAKPGRIWTCRIFCLILMMVSGMKRYPNKIAGRVCLNLYQTEDKLELTTKNSYLAKSHSFTQLFWQEKNQFENFVITNSWIEKFGFSFRKNRPKNDLLTKTIFIFTLLMRRAGEFLFDLFFNESGEYFLKNLQTKRILSDLRTKLSKNGEIFISDHELRFHPKK